LKIWRRRWKRQSEFRGNENAYRRGEMICH
jgi:hypothetical protein